MRLIVLSCLILCCSFADLLFAQQSEVLADHIRTLIVKVDGDWNRPPVADLGKGERITICFDELSHSYHRFQYVIRHCNADWQLSSLFETDYLNGFNDNPVEDYETSINTIMEYTNYRFSIPNERVRLTQSGNYEVSIYDEGGRTSPVAIARFSLVDSKVLVGAQVSANTDIDLNKSHQQVSFTVHYNGLTIRNPQDELKVFVQQNNRPDNRVGDLKPSFIAANSVRYEHNRNLIFGGGNEYRRFEMVSYYHSGMGIQEIQRYGDYYHATLEVDRARKNYIYDEDQNGIFVIRNDETHYPDTEADYMLTHFAFDPQDEDFPDGDLYVQGDFTYNSMSPAYRMDYNSQSGFYENTQLMKQGYYNYQYVFKPRGNGPTTTLFTEGNFYQTENMYYIYVYYRPFAARTDSLVGFFPIQYK